MPSKNRVFFGKLPYDTRAWDIERWLHDYGYKNIGNVYLKTGYAFVDFDDAVEAEGCVKELDRRDFMGVRITVEFARGPRDRDRYDHYDHYPARRPYSSNGYFRERYGAPYNTEWKLIVQNLSSRVGWQDMKDFFRQAGKVTFTECHKHRTGEGIVEFATQEELKRALEKLNREELMGRRIKLIDDSPGANSSRKESYTRVGGRGSRSPSRDHHRSSRRRRSIRSSGGGGGGSSMPRRASSEKGTPRTRERSSNSRVSNYNG